jgi:hypothetical protein
MAKARTPGDTTAPKGDVYTGMLILTAAAMFVGVVALALEANNDYGWESTPPTAPPITLPAPVAPAFGTPDQKAAATLPAPAIAAATPAGAETPALPVSVPASPISVPVTPSATGN